MREIKFRAWLKESKKMRTVNDLTFNKLDSEPVGVNDCGDSNCSTCVDWYEWNQVELMQYTGLKDKNGVEIFEGDCFKDCDGKRNVVTFKNGGFGCAGKLLINYHTKESITTHEPLINYVLDSAEVIGNIYENPELLKE